MSEKKEEEYKGVNNDQEFIKHIETIFEAKKTNKLEKVEHVEYIKFNYDIEFPIKENRSYKLQPNYLFNQIFKTEKHRFYNCIFLKKVKINSLNNPIEFTCKCNFVDLIFVTSINKSITFDNCEIFDLKAENAVFGTENPDYRNKFEYQSEFRLKNSIVKNKFKLANTNFLHMADFSGSTFEKKVIFLNTNFNNTAIFSGVTFKENILFTDTLFAGKTIFSKTVFEKGLDMSQAIIAGYIKLFDIRFKNENFETEYYEKFDKNGYRDAIEIKGVIPVENKVHTFQILKKAYQDQGNFDDATKMRKVEKDAQRILNRRLKVIELISKKESFLSLIYQRIFSKFKLIYRDYLTNNGIILLLNRWSNNHQTSFWTGVWFTLIMAIIFLQLTLFSAPHSDFEWQKLILFLNPTHNIKEIIEGVDTSCFLPYLFDFFGRIMVGFGIYQTVQAFRKFR